MTSVENAPSVEELTAWFESLISDSSGACDALWNLFLALERTSMGIVGGTLDLENQEMLRHYLASPEAMKAVSHNAQYQADWPARWRYRIR